MTGHARRAIAGAGSIVLVLACGGREEAPFAVGTLERDRVELRAETDDPIVEIVAREGDDLAVGALVLRLDDARLAAQRERALARRDEARARLAELVRGPRQELLAEARARLEGDDNAVAIAERELERARDLAGSGVFPAQRVDERRREYDAAVARRDEDRAALAALRNGTTREELDQGRSALAAAEAELADIEVRVGRLAVTAPVAGRLDALPYELGERPRAGDVVAILLAAGAPYARVYVPEPLLVAARQGVAAEVVADGDPRVFRGRVRRLSSEATFTPHYALTERDRSRLSYLAEIELDDPAARELPTGVPVEARFPTAAVAEEER
ncbi:MAG TPA: HlyD family efflux transporter periplasmic adaptor subunit [Thermoanaerobaculia bacterium]|nr:HlyD family efflux transporter periplasmic adaptor subunit [Thermoanaerobaculia bacterium]